MKKNRSARATAYPVVALLLILALRYTPELPEHRPAEVLQGERSVPVTLGARPHSRTETLNRG